MDEFVIGMIVGIIIGVVLASVVWLKIGPRVFKAPPKPPSPLPFIFCGIGSVASLVCAVAAIAYSIYFIKSSQPATATIVELRESRDKDGNLTIYPIYEYSDTNGNKYQDTPNMSDGRRFVVGSQIPVRFLRSSPSESRIDYFSYHWLLPILMAFFSAGLAAASFVLRWNYRRLTSIKPETSK
jgi:hypothetical protein